MTKKRLISGIILILIAAVALIFVVKSVHDGLPVEGEWKGNIHQWKPAYAGEGLVIVLAGIVGALNFLLGSMLMVVGLTQDR